MPGAIHITGSRSKLFASPLYRAGITLEAFFDADFYFKMVSSESLISQTTR